MQPSNNIFDLSDKSQESIKRFNIKSYENTMDVNLHIPTGTVIDKSMYAKKEEHTWLYNTRYYEALTEDQRRELSWLEVGRMTSGFIWLEQTIPSMFMNIVNDNQGKISSEVEDYLMLFSKEEIVHTLGFKRLMTLADMPIWKPYEALRGLVFNVLPNFEPRVRVYMTMLVEWIAEQGAMHSTQSDEIEPNLREFLLRHHTDEIRHLAFGKMLSESFFKHGNPEEVEKVKQMSKELVPAMIKSYSFDAEIGDYTSFEYPIKADDDEKIAELFESPELKKLNEERFSVMYQWLADQDIVNMY
jgi:hypothetical protein